MRELTQIEKDILERHGKWINHEDGGERADLRGADLRGANLCEANLDFSSWPLSCGSFHAKADMRLVAQLAKHLAMLDVSQCCGGIQEAMDHFRQTGLAHLFDEFRNDMDKTPCSPSVTTQATSGT